MKIPKNFRGYAGDPRSELDVAYLFGLLHDYLDFPFVVTGINDAFPDCEGIDPETGKVVNIEFETLSHHFHEHKHPPDGCTYIVCWIDNWPDCPHENITIISLKDLIESKGLTGKRFLDIPAPGSIREELESLKDKNPVAYNAVKHFLHVSLKKIQEQFSNFFIDDSTTKHYVFRNNNLGLGGVYPNGKFVCKTVDEFVKQYGESIREDAEKFREILTNKIGMLRREEDCDAAAKAIEDLLLSLEKLNK